MLNLKKETKIEIFFWLVVVFVFSPRVLLEYYEHKLKNSLIPFENNEWTVKDKDGNVIYENLTLPHDLRWKEQKTNRREWIFEKQVKSEHLKSIKDLGVVLGRIGDSDFVMFNDCMIGSTGFDSQNIQKQIWAWADLRRYFVPHECLQTSKIKISVYIKKFEGPGFGIFGGPLGYGNYSFIKKITNYIDFIRYGIVTAFGIGLVFFIGIQYLFVRLVSNRRENYGIFGLLSITVGMYLIMTGTIPFRLDISQEANEKFIFSCAVFSAYLFLKFFNVKFEIVSSKILNSFALISLILLVSSFFQNTMTEVYKYYELWQLIFIISFIAFYLRMLKKKKIYNDPYYSKYLFAFTIFVFCCLHDILITSFGSSSSYMIGYAFAFFVLVVGLTLSREYSDAFSKVEEQVVERTKQLNQAIIDIQKIQKSKEDQAKRFAHDIRSPLAALQVLKDVALYQLPDDAKNLFKHTIVRINDLANTALPKLIGQDSEQSIKTSVFLWPVIDKIISEKRLEYKHLSDISVDFVAKGNVFELFAKCNETDLARCLSNLINNSVQAKKDNEALSVILLLQKINSFVEITIQDSGKGIPAQLLSKVTEGYSHGKEDGSGIGLSSAKKMIESWQGQLEIHTTENIGTTIVMRLPITGKPKWLATSLKLNNISNLVVIDDQPAVFETWKQKLRRENIHVNISWVPNVSAWDESDAKLDKNRTLFLVDQDLSSSVQGLDLIQQLKLKPHVILVTGNDDDLSLRKRAMDLSILILPKSLIHTIPIEVA